MDLTKSKEAELTPLKTSVLGAIIFFRLRVHHIIVLHNITLKKIPDTRHIYDLHHFRMNSKNEIFTT